MEPAFKPIKIIEVDALGIGSPRNDGTAGFGLYDVPMRLSATPPSNWVLLFQDEYGSPTQFSPQHGRGRVDFNHDRLVLRQTTIEEVATTHRHTLKQAVEATNKRFLKELDERAAKGKAKAEQEAEFKRRTMEAASRIRFDDDEEDDK